MANQVSYAHVQWWTSRRVHVLCPFCDEVHTHGFGGSYNSLDRGAHCSSASYQIKYPFSTTDNTTDYEIDKYNARYVAVGATPPSPNTHVLDEGLKRLSLRRPSEHMRGWLHSASLSAITNGSEHLTVRRLSEVFEESDTFDFKKIDPVPNRIIAFGDLDFLEEYLTNSPEAAAFLEGTDEDGNSALLLAAREKFSLIVERLLDWGAEVDFQNLQGRSPLMEAALWGRHDNVRHLLDYDADKDLRDCEGLRAVDLAKASHRNEEERRRRSGADSLPYSEKTYAAHQARRMIVQLLEDAEDDAVQEPDFNVEGHMFRRRWTQGSMQGIQLVAPAAESTQQYASQKESWKPIAWLARPNDYRPIAAMSGRSHGIATSIVLGHEWTEEVMQLAEIVSHTLEKTEAYDQGQPGRFHACHAEKQLIAYFISYHVFLPHEIDIQGPFQQLALARPPVMLRQAKILVGWKPCNDCIQFVRAVNSLLGLNISLVDCSDTAQ
jgi:hypothetical protein